MTLGLNWDCMDKPVRFMRRYLIVSKSQNFLGRDADNKLQLASGPYTVDLVAGSSKDPPPPKAYLSPREKWGWRSNKIKCYYLSAKGNEINDVILNEDVDYFFTDLLTGCQFLAYGNESQPSIEHNNNLDGKSVDYAD